MQDREKTCCGEEMFNVIDSFNRCANMLTVFVLTYLFIKVCICRLFSEKANPLVDEVES
jgi:hypothetical protein